MDKDDTGDDDLIELFENGFCNNEESHVACKEKREKKHSKASVFNGRSEVKLI